MIGYRIAVLQSVRQHDCSVAVGQGIGLRSVAAWHGIVSQWCNLSGNMFAVLQLVREQDCNVAAW